MIVGADQRKVLHVVLHCVDGTPAVTLVDFNDCDGKFAVISIIIDLQLQWCTLCLFVLGVGVD